MQKIFPLFIVTYTLNQKEIGVTDKRLILTACQSFKNYFIAKG